MILCLRRIATAWLFTFALIAQGSAPSDGKPSLRAVTLFQKDGKDLVGALQKNFYGPGDREGVIRISGDSIWFQPSDEKDHLATPFLNVSSGIPVGVELKGIEHGASKDLVVTLQNGRCEPLAVWRPAQGDLASGAWSKMTEAVATDGKIRLVLNSTGLTAVLLPSRVVVWYDKPPQSFPIWTLAAFLALAGMLIWLVRWRVRAGHSASGGTGPNRLPPEAQAPHDVSERRLTPDPNPPGLKIVLATSPVRFPRTGSDLKLFFAPVLPSPRGGPGHCWRLAGVTAFLVAAVYVSLVVTIDDTNLGTTNGLWKAPDVSTWSHEGRGIIDDGEILYFPVYGFLARLIPDSLLQYGTPPPDVTFRKMALLDALFGGIASGFVFVLAFRFTNSRLSAAVISVLHAGSAFVLLNSINSEDIIPAYTFILAATVCFFEFLHWGGWRLFAASALMLALATLFHWTTMASALAAIGAVFAFLLKRSRVFFLIGAAWLFLFLVLLQALVLLVLPTHHIPVWAVLFPGKAGTTGWLGFFGVKLWYSLVGMGNYFSGGQNVGDYKEAFAYPPLFHSMLLSWTVLGLALVACLITLIRRSRTPGPQYFALFALVLFVAGEAIQVYSQPQDPQSQIEPMFVIVPGAILILCWTSGRTGVLWRLAGATLLTIVAAANGAENIQTMRAGRGLDSQAIAAAQEMDRLFPKNSTVILSQGLDGWLTWQYVLFWRGNSAGLIQRHIMLARPLTLNHYIRATDAAAQITDAIDTAFAKGFRVVASSIWLEPVEDIAASLTTVTDPDNARAYISMVKKRYRTGKQWNTRLGTFVELLPATPGGGQGHP
jgi:hypothetical protein